jgi:3-oxoacyl-[acyl-carrier protein] reductase
MTDSMPEKIREETYQRIAKKNTLQRMGEPEDVVPIIVFLASTESYYVTGQVIEIAGSLGFEAV